MKIKACFAALTAAVLTLALTGCGDTSAADKLIEKQTSAASTSSEDYLLYVPDTESKSYAEGIDAANDGFDVDLTILNATMTYSQVYDMVTNPDLYLGKTVRARGNFAYTTNEEGGEYFAVIIQDATACCGQGIEFVLKGEHSYPKDYPALDTEITVSGVFNTYKEGTYTYCQLLDAEMTI